MGHWLLFCTVVVSISHSSSEVVAHRPRAGSRAADPIVPREAVA